MRVLEITFHYLHLLIKKLQIKGFKDLNLIYKVGSGMKNMATIEIVNFMTGDTTSYLLLNKSE